jgi:hypothetical protein
VNTAATPNSSAVSLFLLLVVVETYVPASSAKRKGKAFSTDLKRKKGRPFLLTCTSSDTVKRFYVKDPKREWVA